MLTLKQRGVTLVELAILVGSIGGLAFIGGFANQMMSYYVVEPVTFVGPNATAVKDAEVQKVETALFNKCLVDTTVSQTVSFNALSAGIANLTPEQKTQLIQVGCTNAILPNSNSSITNVDFYLKDKFQACDSNVLSSADFDACRTNARNNGRLVINVQYKWLNLIVPTYISSGLVECNPNLFYKCS